jgi:phospholipase/lecithinase/hemolysin
VSLTLRVLRTLAVAAVLISVAAAHAQAYTSIVVFGDSLCDTGNDAMISAGLYTAAGQVPGPASGYTNGSFTDGPDTLPAAQQYFGVWIKQLAATLAAKPSVNPSLAGGTNYAYGFATTGTGTTAFTYGPGNALSFNVQNMGLQVSTYLATKPTITSKTLFVVWGGANDLLNATTPTQVAAAVTAAATNDVALVQQLINAGATDFIIPNLPPLGLVPRFNGSATTSVPATQAALAFNQALAAGLATLPAANPGKTLHLFPLDTYTLYNTVVGPPIYKGFANVTAMSQGNLLVNPDTFLFWDNLHPTTFGHSLLAAAALTAINTPVVTSSVLTSSNSNANLNSSITLTDTVTAASGTPTGTVTFMDGTSTVLGTALVFGSTTAGTATLTTSTLTAGTHNITAVFAGVNGYASSTSASLSEVITAPALNTSFASSSITVSSGATGTATLNLSAVGGYSGTATLACGTPLPTHFTCSITPTSVTFPGTITSATVTIGTNASTALLTPQTFTHSASQAFAALLFFPGLGTLAFLTRRRGLTAACKPQLWMLLGLLTLGTLAISGCGPNNNAPAGSYTVPIVVTANSSSSTVNLTVIVQ